MRKLIAKAGLTVFGLTGFANVALADTYTVTTIRDGLTHVFLSWEALFEFLKICCRIV